MDLNQEALKLISKHPPDTFIRGGYWTKGAAFIWIESTGSLTIWEYFPQNYAWQPSQALAKLNRAAVNDEMRLMSLLNTVCHVDTKKAMVASSLSDSVKELVAELQRGGYTVSHPHRQRELTLQEKWKKDGLCPKCGDRGQWIMMGCFCPHHGKFMG